MAVDDVDRGDGGEDLGHSVLGAALQPIGHHVGGDVDVGIVLPDLPGALFTLDLGRDSLETAEFDHGAARLAVFLSELVDDEAARHPSDLPVVGADPGGVGGFRDVPLQADDGNARRAHLGDGDGERSALVRRDDEKIGLFADRGLDLVDLPDIVLRRVHDDEFHVRILAPEFPHAGVLRGPIGFGIVALAEDDEVGPRSGGVPRPRAGAQCEQEAEGRG